MVQWLDLQSLSDDVTYAVYLVASICVGVVFSDCRLSIGQRRWMSTVGGVATTVSLGGYGCLHQMAVCCGNLIILRSVAIRYQAAVSMWFTMSYLLLFRLSAVYISSISPLVNIMQMLVSLRLVGVMFEIRDNCRYSETVNGSADTNQPDTDSATTADTHLVTKLSASDLIHYCYCHVGILTGPYYTFATYYDFVRGTFRPYTSVWSLVWRRARVLPLYITAFLLAESLWPLRDVDDWMSRSWLYRVLMIYPIFGQYRARMYCAFILSELLCMTHGLGLYPEETQPSPGRGPKHRRKLHQLEENSSALSNCRYNFNTVYNIDELAVETDTTMIEVLKKWNMTVQYWLYFTVYANVPGSKTQRALCTMLMSAFWHGIRPGYYLSLLMCPLYMIVERSWQRSVADHITSSKCLTVYHLCTWAARVSMFSYLCVGFRLLDASTTLLYWRSIGFIGHLLPMLMYAVSRLIGRITCQTVHANKTD